MATAAALKEAVTGRPQEPQARELSPYEKLRNYLTTQSFLNEIAVLVGGEAQARTFVRVVLTAVQQTPRLLDADRRSLLLACMKAARDRLMPDGKEAVFNIYNSKVRDPKTGKDTWVEMAQYLPMAAGLIKKLYESGHVTFVDALAVYAKDEFTYERGDAPKLIHKPYLGDDPGQIIAAYVVVKLTNGEIKREVMPRRDIEKVRGASKAADGPGWTTWYDQFAIKSVVKRAYKQLPSSVELEQVIASDNDAMGFRETAGADPEQSMATAEAQRASGDEPAALEHNHSEKVPPMTIDGQSEKVETGAASTQSNQAAAATDPKASKDRPTLAAAAVRKALDDAFATKSRDKLDEAAAQIDLVPQAAQQNDLLAHYRELVANLESDDGK